MELEFDVHVDANALYDYMLRHTFTKAAGILGSTAGALGIVAVHFQVLLSVDILFRWTR